MSDRGIYGVIIGGDNPARTNCIIIGKDVPRVHHSDGVPVYLIVEHPDGLPVVVNNRTKSPAIKNLLAYPSHWAAPGCQGDQFIYAFREPMPWNALIPVFDVALPRGIWPDPRPENVTEIGDRLKMPLPSKI